MSERAEIISNQLIDRIGVAFLSLVIISGLLISLPWEPTDDKVRIIRANERAEILGYQVIQIYQEAIKAQKTQNKLLAQETSQKSLRRAPSSAQDISLDLEPILAPKESGTIGLDPWGNPYNYRVSDTNGQNYRVIVWSSGPPLPHQLETTTKPASPSMVAEFKEPPKIGATIQFKLESN